MFSLGALKCTKHVKHSVSLETALATEIRCTLTKDALDPLGFADKFGVTGHQHRSRSTDVWRGHAGPIEFSPFAAAQTRLYSFARRHNVRLQSSIAGWTTAGKETHAISVWPVTMG